MFGGYRAALLLGYHCSLQCLIETAKNNKVSRGVGDTFDDTGKHQYGSQSLPRCGMATRLWFSDKCDAHLILDLFLLIRLFHNVGSLTNVFGNNNFLSRLIRKYSKCLIIIFI